MAFAALNAAPFALLAAFTSSPFGGNPAAIVFLDPVDTALEVLQGLARNFNQPIIAFVKPPTRQSLTSHVVRTSIRFFMHSGVEVPLCGHATLCAAAAILALPEFQLDLEHGRVGSLVEFEACMTQRRIPVRALDGGQLELGLPVAAPVKPGKEERERIDAFVQQAFRDSGKEVKINDASVGPQGFEYGA
jgi:predicted PhzF superfamily epimerase YddE/YHI9